MPVFGSVEKRMSKVYFPIPGFFEKYDRDTMTTEVASIIDMIVNHESNA